MILIISLCRNNLHNFEFVKPIENILSKYNIKFKTISYINMSHKNLFEAKKIIISGTSLKDDKFLNHINIFNWIKEFEKPILGICGGMHILGLIYNGELLECKEIGLTKISSKGQFFGLIDELEVYELHKFVVKSNEFKIIAWSDKCIQVIEHKQKPFFGVLFHPEVRNKDLILNYATNVVK